MSAANKDHRTSPEQIRLEAEAEAAQAKLVAESKSRLGERCPECNALGSLELIDGVIRCIDCDETVAAKTSLGGLGRN